MFGNNYKRWNQKGVLFIIDFVMIMAVVVLILVFAGHTHHGTIEKQQHDLVYGEAQGLFGSAPNYYYDINKNYLCRYYAKETISSKLKLNVKKETVCTNVLR